MSLSSLVSKTPIMVASPGQSVFPYTSIRILQESDLEVYVNGVLAPESDYTISGVGDANGGNFTFVVPLAGGEEVVARRNPDITQTTLYPEVAPFPVTSHEQAMDKNAMIDQSLKEELTRSLQFPISSGASGALPDNVENTGKFLVFTSTGIGVSDTVANSTLPLNNQGDLVRQGPTGAEALPIGTTRQQLANVAGQVQWSQIPWAQGQCQLAAVGPQLVLRGYDGNHVILRVGTDWVVRTLPFSGVSLNPTSLSNDITYYIYLQEVGGQLQLIPSLNPPLTESTTGFQVNAATVNQLLVGCARLSGGNFEDTSSQRWVRSWFHDYGVLATNSYTSDVNTSSTTYVTNNGLNVSAVLWAGETVVMAQSGAMYAQSPQLYVSAISTDGATANTDAISRQFLTGGLNGMAMSQTAASLTDPIATFIEASHIYKTESGGSLTFIGASPEGRFQQFLQTLGKP